MKRFYIWLCEAHAETDYKHFFTRPPKQWKESKAHNQELESSDQGGIFNSRISWFCEGVCWQYTFRACSIHSVELLSSFTIFFSLLLARLGQLVLKHCMNDEMPPHPQPSNWCIQRVGPSLINYTYYQWSWQFSPRNHLPNLLIAQK